MIQHPHTRLVAFMAIYMAAALGLVAIILIHLVSALHPLVQVLP